MRKIYTVVFALMVLLSVTMSAMAVATAPTAIVPAPAPTVGGAASAGYAATEAPVPYTSTVKVD